MKTETVRNWLRSAAASDDDFEYSLSYMYRAGDELRIQSMPKKYSAVIEEVNLNREYDSYGNMYTEDAYIIFRLMENGNDKGLFKIPGGYASFEGWDWHFSDVTQVEKRSKQVMVWENV